MGWNGNTVTLTDDERTLIANALSLSIADGERDAVAHPRYAKEIRERVEKEIVLARGFRP